MNAVDGQAELGLTRRPNRVDVPIEMVRSRRTAGQAFTLACDASALEDKEICSALEIDKATFSRIKAGNNTLDADLIARFCQIVGNNIYVEWIAYQVSCGLVLLKSEAERRAEVAEKALQEANMKLELMKDLLMKRGGI